MYMRIGKMLSRKIIPNNYREEVAQKCIWTFSRKKTMRTLFSHNTQLLF